MTEGWEWVKIAAEVIASSRTPRNDRLQAFENFGFNAIIELKGVNI